jgi:hypothetical protein
MKVKRNLLMRTACSTTPGLQGPSMSHTRVCAKRLLVADKRSS